jgi:undecaprenyl-diphosphatase
MMKVIYGMTRAQVRLVTLWLVLVAAFCALAGFALVHSYFPGDLWLILRIQDIDNEAFARAVDWAEDIADGRLLIWVYAVIGLALLVTGHWFEAGLLLLTFLARSINSLAKEIIERSRPTPDLVIITDPASGFGFPSGHASGALLLYGFLAYLAEIMVPQLLVRRLVQAFCIAIIGLTWLERMYVGAHWPSDVLGGGFLGAAFLIPIVWLHQLYRLRQLRKSAIPSLTK